MLRWILIGVKQVVEFYCNFFKKEMVIEIDSVSYQ